MTVCVSESAHVGDERGFRLVSRQTNVRYYRNIVIFFIDECHFLPRPWPTVAFDASFKERRTRDFKTNTNRPNSIRLEETRNLQNSRSSGKKLEGNRLCFAKSLCENSGGWNEQNQQNQPATSLLPTVRSAVIETSAIARVSARRAGEAERFEQAFRALEAENQRGTERVETAARRERGKRILAGG